MLQTSDVLLVIPNQLNGTSPINYLTDLQLLKKEVLLKQKSEVTQLSYIAILYCIAITIRNGQT